MLIRDMPLGVEDHVLVGEISVTREALEWPRDMFYYIDPTAQGNRHFASTQRYSEIDWMKLDEIVDGFRQRIDDWYLGPARELAKNDHHAFSVMGLSCLLIDMLSQFYYDRAGGDVFKDFVRDRLPGAYHAALSTPIRHTDSKVSNKQLIDLADVLYHGFRCGILHEAHVTPYGLVDPGLPQPIRVEPLGYLKYKDGNDCPAVIVNPLEVLKDVECAFRSYLYDLKDRDPQNDPLRKKFKSKFKKSFGIDIDSAV